MVLLISPFVIYADETIESSASESESTSESAAETSASESESTSESAAETSASESESTSESVTETSASESESVSAPETEATTITGVITAAEITTTVEETTTAEETTALNPVTPIDDSAPSYVYNVTIEFGYFSFYYDWGVWDVNAFVYKASTSSNNPGAHTTLGDPGWYGFDGINNRIYIENNSPNGTDDLLVSIRFDSGTDVDGVVFPVTGVEMTCYVRANDISALALGETWTVPNLVEYDENNNLSITQTTVPLVKMEPMTDGSYQVRITESDSIERRTVYISFSGEPMVKGTDGNPTDTQFIGTTMTKIGFITIGLGLMTAE